MLKDVGSKYFKMSVFWGDGKASKIGRIIVVLCSLGCQ